MTTDIFSGDDVRLEFTVTADDGTALDLTNMSIEWGLAKSPASSLILTKSSTTVGEIEVVDAVSGRFDVILVPADTVDLGSKSLYHEVELTDVGGSEFTVFNGRLYVRETLV